jgi:hypothetical protein
MWTLYFIGLLFQQLSSRLTSYRTLLFFLGVTTAMAFHWTEDIEDKMIACWREHPCLYDTSSKDYHNRVSKQDVLEKISTEIGCTGQY